MNEPLAFISKACHDDRGSTSALPIKTQADFPHQTSASHLLFMPEYEGRTGSVVVPRLGFGADTDNL